MSNPSFEERYAVTLFGFTNELLLGAQTPLQILEQTLASGITKNVEIDGPQFFRNFPNVVDEEVLALCVALAKFDARLSLLGGYADRASGVTLHSSETVVSSLIAQLDLVRRLGGFGLRLQVDAFSIDEAPAIARAAEAAGVMVVFELQGSMTPTDPRTLACVEVVRAADSPNVRLMLDSSLFMTCFPPSLQRLMGKTGLSTSQIAELEEHWLRSDLGEFRTWLIGQLQSGQVPGQVQALMPTFLSRIGHSKPADWQSFTPMIESVHLKYWDTSDEGGAVTGPTSELIQMLESAGYQGYYCSEWGGHEWHTLEELSGAQATSWHKTLVKILLS